MKPAFSKSDHDTLKKFLQQNYTRTHARELKLLASELDRAEVLDKPATEYVTLNSQVEFEDTQRPKPTRIQIVLPHLANIPEGKISLLAPLSIALLGFKKGDTIDWQMPSGKKTIKILDVVNP